MPDPREAGVDRLLAFSDGVFAIAVTLLVLDLREPDVPHGLLATLITQWPSYLGYVLSFLIVGIIWALHHRVFQIIRHTDYVFILINVVFLMWVAVVPFPTGLLARYLDNPSERQTATAIYAGVFLVGGLLVNLQWQYAIRHDHLIANQVDRGSLQRLTLNYALGPVLYWRPSRLPSSTRRPASSSSCSSTCFLRSRRCCRSIVGSAERRAAGPDVRRIRADPAHRLRR